MKCRTERFLIGELFERQGAIDIFPPYQREGGAWNLERKQLFLDTLLNGYDSPKIYFHALSSGPHNWALVDGKQRLECIWDFIDKERIKARGERGALVLGKEFSFTPSSNYGRNKKPYPKAGDAFTNLSTEWQSEFKRIGLDVVMIEDANDAYIEEIFSRLNNGEPLNAAEKRNAMPGKMPGIIRGIAKHKFFTKTVSLSSKRYQHCDIAARFLLIEKGIIDGSSPYRDLKKRFLDNMVKDNQRITEARTKDLTAAVRKQLNSLCKVFGSQDPLLRLAGYPQLYYLFIKEVEANYASPKLSTYIKKFISEFPLVRENAKARKEDAASTDEKYRHLSDFEILMRQGNDESSLKKRVEIMCRFFLLDYPSVKLRSKKRAFTGAERYVIYILGGKKCAKCKKKFQRFEEFEADHIIQWAHGGQTTLKNAQALCKSCNAGKNRKTA